MENDIDLRKITGLLADEERFKIVAAVSLGAKTMEKIAAMTGLDNPVIIKALLKLEEAGIIGKKATGYVFNISVLQTISRDVNKNAPKKTAPAGIDRFFKDGKLVTYPKAPDDQMTVLQHIAALFEYNRRYTEKEINEKLKEVNPDYASYRRYLIDKTLLVREHVTDKNGHTIVYYWRVEQI
jgi:hypothetical protein